MHSAKCYDKEMMTLYQYRKV